MPRVIWSKPARDDLHGIDDYLTRETSPGYAVRVLSAIRARAKFLESFPRGARPLPDATRVLRVFETPYLIRYRLGDQGVEVLRVHHEREDWFVEP